ncbi:MAG: ABC transporter permease [Clostridia bacterium]|nr:ABC transporter permease [Clostridia bacterium]
MTLFLREMKRNRKAFIIWTLILIGYSIMVMSMFPTMLEQADQMKEYLKSMKGWASAFGADQLDFANILSFFGVYSLLYFSLAASIYSMILGASILSKEESDKTIEFLLAKPITRKSIVSAKLLCILTYIVLINVVYFLASTILIEIYKNKDVNMNYLISMFIGSLLICLMFAVVGMLISVFIVKAKSVYPIAIGTVIGTFIIGGISGISEDMKWLKYLAPFKYFEASDIIENKGLDPVYISIAVLAAVVSIICTYVFYCKKEIKV